MAAHFLHGTSDSAGRIHHPEHVRRVQEHVRRGDPAGRDLSRYRAVLPQAEPLCPQQIRGGEKAEVFIRINDPEKLERLVTSGKYTNGVLQSIQEHHRNNERLLTAFFSADMNDDERWELIEQYFLGNEEYVRRILHIAD